MGLLIINSCDTSLVQSIAGTFSEVEQAVARATSDQADDLYATPSKQRCDSYKSAANSVAHRELNAVSLVDHWHFRHTVAERKVGSWTALYHPPLSKVHFDRIAALATGGHPTKRSSSV